MTDSNRPIYSGMTSPSPISYSLFSTGTTVVNGVAYPDLNKLSTTGQTYTAIWDSPCPSPTPTPSSTP
jgi:hypothetical protein